MEESFTYDSLLSRLSDPSQSGLKSFGFTTLTEIQEKTIPHLLDGKDLRGTAKTGSGKTLAFLLPSIEFLVNKKFSPQKGLGILILSPTRELAKQIFEVAEQLASYHEYTCGLVTGGKHKKEEYSMLENGVNILVATPGRLLDHLKNTESFKYKHLKCLILDEADKMLDTGFEDSMKQIMSHFPKRKQTMLFSATKTTQTNKLVEDALNDNFVDIDVTLDTDLVTVDGLDQSYVICSTDKKFLLLCHLIKSLSTKKVMVFLNCCITVKYYKDLLSSLSMKVLSIHGHQPQADRTAAFEKFKRKRHITLLCTDVAARGWDIPEVDVVIQYDPPSTARDYIHRVGRTARADKEGKALLFLREEESSFIPHLQTNRINIKKRELIELPDRLNEKIIGLVEGDEFLKYWASKAYKKYLEAYSTHSMREVFDVNDIDPYELLTTFGLSEPSLPKLDFDLILKKPKKKKRKLEDKIL